MKKALPLTLLITCFCFNAINAQVVRRSTAWFGPNAFPVPEFTDARIPAQTALSLMGDHYSGFGDITKNIYVKGEFPLLPQRVSIGIWCGLFEQFNATQEIKTDRFMLNDTFGLAHGDIYIQTRMLLLKEKKFAPDIIFNTTLKTATGTHVTDRRYFDTPGYYFDMEFGKNIFSQQKNDFHIRMVGNLGFLSYETTGARQNDAFMYGAKIITDLKQFSLETSFRGYWGWMHTHPDYGPDFGDTPLVAAFRLNYTSPKFLIFSQYQHGIRDFPFHQLRLGISMSLKTITPAYTMD